MRKQTTWQKSQCNKKLALDIILRENAKAMSHFSTQLGVSSDRAGYTRAALASAAGLSYHVLTALALDRRQADPDTLSSLCRVLPRAEAAALLVARLRDEIPADAADLVHLWPADGVLRDDPAPYTLPELPEDLRRALDKLARAAVLTKEWRDLILDLARIC
jgi:hypothetical protein